MAKALARDSLAGLTTPDHAVQALALGTPPLSTCAALSGTAQASSRHHASTASPDAGRSSAADGAAGAQPGRRRGPFPPGRRRVEANDTALQGRLLQIDALPAHASRDDVLDIFAACGIPMAVRDVQPAFAQSSLHLLPRVHHWEATLGTPQLRDRALRLLRAQRVVRTHSPKSAHVPDCCTLQSCWHAQGSRCGLIDSDAAHPAARTKRWH